MVVKCGYRGARGKMVEAKTPGFDGEKVDTMVGVCWRGEIRVNDKRRPRVERTITWQACLV
jgi:hypothetical protein